MIRTTLVLAALAFSACYPLRNARIIDGSENEPTAWICVPEQEEPLNAGGIQCARIDRVLGMDVDPTQPADAGTITF